MYAKIKNMHCVLVAWMLGIFSFDILLWAIYNY